MLKSVGLHNSYRTSTDLQIENRYSIPNGYLEHFGDRFTVEGWNLTTVANTFFLNGMKVEDTGETIAITPSGDIDRIDYIFLELQTEQYSPMDTNETFTVIENITYRYAMGHKITNEEKNKVFMEITVPNTATSLSNCTIKTLRVLENANIYLEDMYSIGQTGQTTKIKVEKLEQDNKNLIAVVESNNDNRKNDIKNLTIDLYKTKFENRAMFDALGGTGSVVANLDEFMIDDLKDNSNINTLEGCFYDEQYGAIKRVDSDFMQNGTRTECINNAEYNFEFIGQITVKPEYGTQKTYNFFAKTKVDKTEGELIMEGIQGDSIYSRTLVYNFMFYHCYFLKVMNNNIYIAYENIQGKEKIICLEYETMMLDMFDPRIMWEKELPSSWNFCSTVCLNDGGIPYALRVSSKTIYALNLESLSEISILDTDYISYAGAEADRLWVSGNGGTQEVKIVGNTISKIKRFNSRASEDYSYWVIDETQYCFKQDYSNNTIKVKVTNMTLGETTEKLGLKFPITFEYDQVILKKENCFLIEEKDRQVKVKCTGISDYKDKHYNHGFEVNEPKIFSMTVNPNGLYNPNSDTAEWNFTTQPFTTKQGKLNFYNMINAILNLGSIEVQYSTDNGLTWSNRYVAEELTGEFFEGQTVILKVIGSKNVEIYGYGIGYLQS